MDVYVVPFIIASQARRNANLPLLGLQGIILYASIVALAPAWSADHALPGAPERRRSVTR